MPNEASHENQLSPLNFPFGSHNVRVVLRDGEPWFVAADVCAVLGIGNVSQALKRLDDDEQTLISNEGIHAGPGNPTVNVINESGLYSLILSSRKPEAKRFKKWVTAEVLPAIRKTGSYGGQASAPPSPVSDAARRIADERHAERLLYKVRGETDPLMRQELHALLVMVYARLGRTAPPLGQLGHDAPPEPELLPVFWAVVAQLEARGIQLNHHRKADKLAYNLPQIRSEAMTHALWLPETNALSAALEKSRAPMFIKAKNINSRLTPGAVWCWVFEAPRAAAQPAPATSPQLGLDLGGALH